MGASRRSAPSDGRLTSTGTVGWAAGAAVRLFEAATGKQIGEPITHTLEITDLSLNQCGPNTERKLCFIDRNRDLYITPVLKPQLVKMGTMCDSAVWNDATDMLATMIDQKLVVWYFPTCLFIDKDLVPLTKFVKEGRCGPARPTR